MSLFNPFHASFLFLYPLKMSEKQRFPGGIEMGHWREVFFVNIFMLPLNVSTGWIKFTFPISQKITPTHNKI